MAKHWQLREDFDHLKVLRRDGRWFRRPSRREERSEFITTGTVIVGGDSTVACNSHLKHIKKHVYIANGTKLPLPKMCIIKSNSFKITIHLPQV